MTDRTPEELGEEVRNLLYYGQVDLRKMKSLIEEGARLDVESWEGRTLLMTAAMMRKPEAITLLLDYGAPANQQNCRGETALMEAVHSYGIEAVDPFIGRANLFLRNSQGLAALDIAERSLGSDSKIAALLRQAISVAQKKQAEHNAWRKAGMPVSQDVQLLKPAVIRPGRFRKPSAG